MRSFAALTLEQGWVPETETETEYPNYRYFFRYFGNVITRNEKVGVTLLGPETK